VGKIAKKTLGACVFVISAFKIQRHVDKNTLLQTAFSVVLPTGKGRYTMKARIFQKVSARFCPVYIIHPRKIHKEDI